MDSELKKDAAADCMKRIVRISDSEARYIEGYAAALQDAMAHLTGENGCSKSYDPMTVSDDGKTLHSYAFDMLDGGRHHPASDYKNAAEIKDVLLLETVKRIREDYEPNAEVKRGDTTDRKPTDGLLAFFEL